MAHQPYDGCLAIALEISTAASGDAAGCSVAARQREDKMEYSTLNTGRSMPVPGLGIYALRGKECERTVPDAVALGYRLFDTARMYGNEKELGNALGECRVPREKLFRVNFFAIYLF